VQWKEPEAALVGAGGAPLLGVGGEGAGGDVEDQLLGSGAGIPATLQGFCPSGADRFEQIGVEGFQHPVGRRLRRHRPKQRLLAAQHAEVKDVIAAIGDRHREVAQEAAGVVGRQRFRVGAIASASAAVRPSRSESSTNRKAPAWETSPSPSALTSMVWRVVCVFTFRVSS
jgi:hypothetical protein